MTIEASLWPEMLEKSKMYLVLPSTFQQKLKLYNLRIMTRKRSVSSIKKSLQSFYPFTNNLLLRFKIRWKSGTHCIPSTISSCLSKAVLFITATLATWKYWTNFPKLIATNSTLGFLEDKLSFLTKFNFTIDYMNGTFIQRKKPSKLIIIL